MLQQQNDTQVNGECVNGLLLVFVKFQSARICQSFNAVDEERGCACRVYRAPWSMDSSKAGVTRLCFNHHLLMNELVGAVRKMGLVVLMIIQAGVPGTAKANVVCWSDRLCCYATVTLVRVAIIALL